MVINQMTPNKTKQNTTYDEKTPRPIIWLNPWQIFITRLPTLSLSYLPGKNPPRVTYIAPPTLQVQPSVPGEKKANQCWQVPL